MSTVGASNVINTFSNGSSTVNMSSDTLLYIITPKNATISSAYLSIQGYDQLLKVQNGSNYTTIDSFINLTNATDNDYNTFARRNCTGSPCSSYLYANYTIILGVVPGEVLHQIKTDIAHSNYTVPSGCLNSSTLLIRMKLLHDGATNQIQDRCRDWNALNWANLGDHANADDLYEEDIIWGTRQTKNLTISINNGLVFNDTGNLEGLNQSIDLDINKDLTKCTAEGGNCSIFFNASVWGYSTALNLSILTNPNINFSIYNEQTNQLINQDVDIELISDIYAANYTFAGGNGNLSVILNSQYEIRYKTDKYFLRSYYLVTGNKGHDLKLYALNDSIGSTIEFYIQDESGKRLENATLKALRGFIEGNAEVFRVVEMDRSNFEGIAVLGLEPLTAKYKFIVEHENTTIFFSSSASKLSASSYTITQNIYEDSTGDYFSTRNLATSLTLSSDNETITYSLNDPTNNIAQFCLNIDVLDNLNPKGYIDVCDNCVEAATGSIVCNVSAYKTQSVTFTYQGDFTTQGGYSDTIKSGSIEFNPIGANELGIIGVFLSVFIVLAFVFAGLALLRRTQGAVVGLNLGVIIVKLIGFVNIAFHWIVGLVIVSGILLKIIGDNYAT